MHNEHKYLFTLFSMLLWFIPSISFGHKLYSYPTTRLYWLCSMDYISLSINLVNDKSSHKSFQPTPVLITSYVCVRWLYFMYCILAVWKLTDGLYTTSLTKLFLLRLLGFRYRRFCKNKYIPNVRKTTWEYKFKGKKQRGTWKFCKCLHWGYVPSSCPAPLASMSEECKMCQILKTFQF